MEKINNIPVIETFIPNDDSIASFHGLPLTQKLRVIRLGLAFLTEGDEQIQTWNNKEWNDKLQRLTSTYTKQETVLKEKINDIEQRFVNYRLSQQEAQQILIEDVKAAERVRYETDINRLISTNNDLEKRITDLINQLHQAHDTLESKYTERMRQDAIRYEERLEELRKKNDSLVTRTTNSTLKGKDGEIYVFGKLNMLFPKAEIEDTHTIPHRGDFILREDNFTMMIETKNYSRNVQKAEIDKFYRDIDNNANSDIQCAVFVSLNTGICNKDDFCFEIRNKRPILFIHNLNSNFELLLLAVKFFKLINEQNGVDLSSKQVTDSFKNIATTLKRGFSKQRTRIDKFHSQQLEWLAEQETNIAELYATAKVRY